MATLVVGANGATGKRLVEQLLASGQKVKVVVRSTSKYPDHWNSTEQLTVIRSDITKISSDKLSEHLVDCDSIACCLGHNLTWRGIFGEPRRLVADAVVLLCEAVMKVTPGEPVRLALMNVTVYRNPDLNEPILFVERIVKRFIRLLLPPFSDHQQAGDYLRNKIGQDNPFIEWAVIRPDILTDDEELTPYSLHVSPLRSPVFKPGNTSRVNVAHFMSRLLLDDQVWRAWKGQMPVIYNGGDK